MPQSPAPDTGEMIAVHNVFRESFADAADLVSSAAGDAGRAAMVGNFYDNVLDFLTVHHDGEDTLVTPLLMERAGGDRETITRIADQHEPVARTARGTREALAAWSAHDGGRRRGSHEDVAVALGTLADQLIPHLDEEEAELLPLCAEHMSLEEWGALPAHGFTHFSGDKIWLVLGLIRQNMTHAQRDAMLANMPPPAVEMWTTMGERSFDELMGSLRMG